MAELSNKSLEIIFGGDLHEIDADLFINSLVNYSFVTQEASSYLSPTTKINIKIKAIKQGSFKVLLDLVTQSHLKDLFTKENISLSASIVTIVAGLYSLRKWIAKNGNPKTVKHVSEDEIRIENNNGNITINQNVYRIYQENPKVREKLRNTFNELKEREEIKNFSIRDSDTNNDIFKAEREDFYLLASSDDEVEQRTQSVIKESQELSVFKVVFRENYKWEFFYNGSKIYASIKDRIFFNKIEKGEVAFRSGDRLIVKLEIKQVFNEVVNIFVNDSYHILQVIEHIPREPLIQGSFDFEDEVK